MTLFWVYFLGVTGALAIMAPSGGRVYAAAYFPSSWWKYAIVISFALFALGVAAQLVRAHPRLSGTPPRKDLSWLPTVLGVPTILKMLQRVNEDIGVDPLWLVLTCAVLAVSIAYCLIRIVQRRRDPQLSRLVDAGETTRERTLRDTLLRHADECAERLAARFQSLPASDRRRLTDSLERAAQVLRERGLIYTPASGRAKRPARAQVKNGRRRSRFLVARATGARRLAPRVHDAKKGAQGAPDRR